MNSSSCDSNILSELFPFLLSLQSPYLSTSVAETKDIGLGTGELDSGSFLLILYSISECLLSSYSFYIIY